MQIPLDYETLRVIWWGLMGVLLIGFALTDGFDLGVAALLPFVARSDDERRMVINAIGATWEGNQVWFILGGGAIFTGLALCLCGQLLRLLPGDVRGPGVADPASRRFRVPLQAAVTGVAFDLGLGAVRGRVCARAGVRRGRRKCPAGHSLPAGWRPAGNLHRDVLGPVHALHPGLRPALGGHAGHPRRGLADHQGRARRGARPCRTSGSIAAILAIVLFAAGYAFVAFGGLGFRTDGVIDPAGPSNPLRAASLAAPGGWLANFTTYPWMWIAPVLGFAGAALAFVGIRAGREIPAFAGSSASATGIIATVGLSMFPFLLPSSIDAKSSLTVWNASSSHMTLFIMLLVTVVFLPIVLAYTAWAYKVMLGRSSVGALTTNPDLY